MEKKEETPQPKDYTKQTKKIIIIMVVLLAVVVLTHFTVKEMNKFEYKNMNFYKEKEGNILFYKSLLGFVSANGEEIPFILKLRNNPLELDKIPVNGSVSLKTKAVISLSPSIANCSGAYVTLIDFSRTLKAFGVTASAATTDEDYAAEHSLPVKECKDAEMEETIIVMKEGNETRINKNEEFKEYIIISKADGQTQKITKPRSCYILEIKDCQVQQSFERFAVEIISGMMVK